MANNGKTSSLSNKILDAFEILAQAEVNSAQFDKTITGIIVACEDEATGRYRVQYQDAIFYAYSSALDVTYTKGTSVQVKIPNNDFSGRKIIIGTVEENGIDYGTIVEDPLLRYEYIGVDCIGSVEQNDLSSYWNDTKNNIVLYDKEQGIDELDLNEEMIANNLTQGNSVLLGATFRTSIPDVQRFKGDYGIKYTLTFNDKSNVSATVDRYYIVDIDKMSGDPYAFDKAVDQIVPFDIDNENFCYVKKIELFAKNFIYKDDTKPADIFISNLRFQVAHRIPDEEFAGTALSILTPEGNYFNAVEGMTSKRAIAQLRIKGKVTESITKQIKYYWFIEDLRIDKTNEVGYHKYGGKGWRCLNLFNVTEGTEENPVTVDYVSGEDLFMIEKSNSNSKETKYKCVINYNGQILEKEFYFTNYDIKNEVVIIADRNPNFIDSIGATTLTCVATDGITYQWARVDAEGGFEALDDTTGANNDYEHAMQEYNNLQAAMIAKTEPANDYNYDLLNYYESVMNNYENEERRKENQIINLQASSIYGEATYKCQAFDKDGNSLGIGSQLVTNYLSAEDNLQTGSLVINNGAQVFKYNAKGIAPTSEQFDNPQVILPLGFTLRNAQGIEIPMEALKDIDVTWIVPIKDTMIKSYIGTVVSHDEELGIEVYNGKSLGYNINENYYANKDNNEIELRVQYQGLVYIAKTNLFFTKDGDNGTNGTDYVLKILPSTDTIGRLKTVKAGQTGADWLRIQLWYNGIKIYEGNRTGNATTGKQVKLTWEMVGEHKDTTHNITVQSNGANPPTWTAAPSYISTATDIAKAIVEYDGTRIVATTPIIFSSNWNNTNYKVSLKNGTGFTHVVYSEDGLTPNYDSHTPFEISVQKLINGEWGDITGHSSLTYNWSTVGNLKIKSGYTNTMAAVMFEPVGKYNSEETNNAIICTIKEGSATIGTLHIPVHFLLNTYGHAALNEWDGNSISLDADGGTMLLAPQGGFGKKETDNSYTGIMLGTVKDYTNNVEHTGMFGYKAGTRTMFLNSENGSAIFGSTGSAQIVIDPTQENARLYSNDFYKSYDSKTGLPTSYGESNENTGHDANNPNAGKGALIDLTKPEIRWGNKNFMVNEQGFLTAQGGGKIAGWKINDYRIDSVDNGTGSDKTGKTGMSSVYTADAAGVTQWNVKVPKSINSNGAVNKPIAFWAGGTGTSGKFHVAHDGFVRMQEASIGSGSNNSLIYIGKSGDNSVIHTFNKPTFNTSANGFYIGTDGIALGPTFDLDGTAVSNFQITSDGKFVARNGYIGGRTKGWTVTDTNIYNTKNALDHDSNGVFISTSGISLGKLVDYKDVTGSTAEDKHSKFKVKSDGTLYANGGYFRGKINANGGYIAGWKINTSTITGGNITLNSNGSMSGGDDTHKWSIGTNGAASFQSVTITGGSLNIKDVFKVDADGNMTSTSGNIGGWNIDSVQLQKTIGDYTFEIRSDRPTDQPALLVYKNKGDNQGYKFYVRPDGYLYAQNAYIEGNMQATLGRVGNWYIDNGAIKYNNENNFYLGSNGAIKFGNFSVDTNGNITANGGTFNNVTVYGTIESNSGLSGGKIAGTTISGSTFTAGTINISSGGYYLKKGYGTDHPEVSGLNVTSTGGINMHGYSGISGCTTIGNGGAVWSFDGSTISTGANVKINGGSAYLYIGERTLSQYVNDVIDAAVTGATREFNLWPVGRNERWRMTFENGLLQSITCRDGGDTYNFQA